jgi:NAD(P)-dependent dehydrogenase (short-subunit alcohol dehydrogenase family)
MSINKNILITGGNKGIGLALTRMFLDRDGYDVTVVARDFSEFPFSGRANEVASAMFWLAADCPEYINGTFPR